MSKHLVLLYIFIIPLLVLPKDTNFVNQRTLNSKASEAVPIVSADGNIIFFDSDKKGKRRWKKWKKNCNFEPQ